MSFEERHSSEKIMAKALSEFFTDLGFVIENIGYETTIRPELREKLRFIYDSPTVSIIRFLPDRFAYLDKENITFLEFKICNTAIYSDNRVKFLQEKSGDKTLNKKNIGAIETSAIENYKRLSTIGAKILIVIYSNFHDRLLVANWIEKITIVHQDEVKLGFGNASRTPYTNVNLDEFHELKEFITSHFKLGKEKVEESYNRCFEKLKEIK